jgi:hypothetical protein
MDTGERTRFLEAIAETARHMREAQKALRLARAQCHGEVYEQVEVMCMRAYELQVTAEWLQHMVLGNIALKVRAANDEGRQGPDRRKSVDRRIAGMRKQMLLPEG